MKNDDNVKNNPIQCLKQLNHTFTRNGTTYSSNKFHRLNIKNFKSPFYSKQYNGTQVPAAWNGELQKGGQQLIIIEVELKNSQNPGWMDYWKAELYDHLTDDSRLIDSTYLIHSVNNVQTGNIWVGHHPNMTTPNLFRIWRNLKSFEDRRQGTNEWAEIHVRYMTKYPLPKDTGKMEIQLPGTFDIPNGGTNICKWGHNNHTDLTG